MNSCHAGFSAVILGSIPALLLHSHAAESKAGGKSQFSQNKDVLLTAGDHQTSMIWRAKLGNGLQ
jgi:hypothetical protein